MAYSVGYGEDSQLLLGTEDAAAVQSNSAIKWEAWESVALKSLQRVGSTEQLQGFAALKPEDQQKVAAALGGSAAAPPAPPAEASITAPSSASAAASAELHLSAVLLPHLPLLDTLLQDTHSICSLMCTDKELLAFLKNSCEGQLPLVFRAYDSAHELQFAKWLEGEHSCGSSLLAGHVELQLLRKVKYDQDSWPVRWPFLRPVFWEQDSVRGAGFEEGRGPVLLAQQIERLREVNTGESQSQDAWGEGHSQDKEAAAIASGLLLHSLQAATQVTSLSLTRDCYEGFAACSCAMQSLAGLTNLRSINISSWNFSECPAPLFKALQDLYLLTSLTVSRVTGTSKLRYLPQSLLLLGLGVCSPGICLTHLTNLTALRTDKLFSLESGDLLPASLQQLEFGEINSVQRLVGLTALRSLAAYASHVPELRLQRLAKSLTQLTRVQLCYKSGANDAAAAWPLLRVQHLELQEVDALTSTTLLPTTLQQISCLTKLTYLQIQRLDSVQADTWEIAKVLHNLSQLQGLRLWAAGPWPQNRSQQQQQQQGAAPAAARVETRRLHMADSVHPGGEGLAGYARFVRRMQQRAEERERRRMGVADGDDVAVSAEDAAAAAAAAAAAEESSKAGLTGVIAALPHLSNLSLSLQGLGSAAAAELGTATGLTSLKLRACGIDSVALAGLASELKGLKSLFVEYNLEVDDTVLPVLLHELTELTELDVRYTGVSSTGGELLQTVTRLQQLQL